MAYTPLQRLVIEHSRPGADRAAIEAQLAVTVPSSLADVLIAVSWLSKGPLKAATKRKLIANVQAASPYLLRNEERTEQAAQNGIKILADTIEARDAACNVFSRAGLGLVRLRQRLEDQPDLCREAEQVLAELSDAATILRGMLPLQPAEVWDEAAAPLIAEQRAFDVLTAETGAQVH